jgi:hypothetical protein
MQLVLLVVVVVVVVVLLLLLLLPTPTVRASVTSPPLAASAHLNKLVGLRLGLPTACTAAGGCSILPYLDIQNCSRLRC